MNNEATIRSGTASAAEPYYQSTLEWILPLRFDNIEI